MNEVYDDERYDDEYYDDELSECESEACTETDYREEYFKVLHENNELRCMTQHSRELFWSRLFACYLGGCLAFLFRVNEFSSLKSFLLVYAGAVLCGVCFGFMIRIVDFFFDCLIEGASLKGIRTILFWACLAAPLVLLFIMNRTPEPWE